MISKVELLKSLKDKSVTLGWDAVAIYEREHVNRVMEQQYVKKMAEGTHFPIISKELTDIGDSQTVILDSLLIGTPLISFEESDVESSYVKVRLEFISGTVTVLNSNHAIDRIDDVNSVNGYALELKVALENVTGEVDQQGQVLIHFANSSLLDVNFPGMSLPTMVKDLFRDYLKNNPVTYVLNTIDVSGNNILTPQKFIVRTQAAPGATRREAANYGNGAVLVFIATKANSSGGTLPSNKYPWLLPKEHSSTLILNNKVLFDYFIRPQAKSLFEESDWESVRVNESVDDSAFCLKAKHAGVVNDPAEFKFAQAEIWTGGIDDSDKAIKERYRLSLDDFYFKSNESGIVFSSDKSEKFNIDFGVKVTRCGANPAGGTICWDEFNSLTNTFKFDGNVYYKAILNEQGDISIVNTDGHFTLVDKSELPEWWEPNWNPTIFSEFSQVVNKKMDDLKNIHLPDIKVGLLSHIIFPSDVEIKLSDVYIPGDMVLFGELAPKSTAFRVHPLRSVVGLTDTRQFNVEPGKSVSWKISPSLGSINAVNGLYTAPAGTLKDDKTLTVSATDSAGAVASASVVLTESATALAPTFIAVEEPKEKSSSIEAIDFSWFSTDDSQATSWSLDSTLPEATQGSISSEGKYTAPAKFASGTYIVSVKAQNDDGKTTQAYVCLKSNQSRDDVTYQPPTHQEVRAGETVEFIVTAVSFPLGDESWRFYPEKLGEWQWEEIASDDDDVFCYRVKYTAPEVITQREMAFVLSNQSVKRVGVGAVMLVPGANNWDLVTSIEELSISLLSSENAGSIFANGRNQLPIAINIKGLNANDDDREVPLSLGDIIDHLELVDYTTGEPLRYEETRGWFYSQTKNEFQTLPEGSARALQGNNLLYVMCDQNETLRTKRVALRVTLTSPEADQKVYWTGANSGVFDSSVVVKAQELIDYSQIDNLSMVDNELQSVSKPLAWGYKRGTYYAEKNNGQYYKKRVDIKPKNVSRFHSVEIKQRSIWNADLKPELIRWNDKTVESFSVIDSSGGAPAAVYATNKRIVSADDEYTELNLWYTQQRQPTDVRIEGDVYFVNADHDDPTYYGQYMQPDWADKGQLTETDGLASFYLYKLRLGVREGDNEKDQPQININGKPDHWVQAMPEITVSVVDIYGNRGTFTVYWNNINGISSDADKPLIK